MAVLQKACICPFENGRAQLDNRFYVQFNPSELTVEEAIGISRGWEGYGEGQPYYANGTGIGWQRPVNSPSGRNRLTLSVPLFFNTFTSFNQDSYQDVREYICQLYPYTNKSRENNSLTQICFLWGSIAVAGMLSRMSVHYTMFAPDGKPVRATVQLSVTGDYVGEEAKNGAGGAENRPQGEDEAFKASSPDWRETFQGKNNPRLVI